ncbi:alpha/beta fold hydrolase [Altererythrobacter xixiisoli]|uniref:Alpha/beta fold hydrolase n=1 Tax=Croceibacterium xixiisoli TaxID=1476466 RepID=A0A6I4TY13_9SPHN|nr:alpha/beta fold hydrolase [Croceibacterium xixiisoli]
MRACLTKIGLLLAALFALLPQAALAQRAGELIEASPVADAPADMRAWRIRYWTTADNNQLIAVTGMVIAPKNRAPSPQVLAWTHGLIGIAQRCAPSLGTTNFTMIPSLSEVISQGYTVVAPDYPGLGSDMVHPVLVGTSEGRSVLDAVRAHRAIAEADAGTRFAVWGESQGGHAALWTGQLWRDYAPDLQLVGIAAIVPPTDLPRNFQEGSDARVRALLTSYTATAWSRYYGAPMSTFGSRQTQNVMTRLADNNCVQFDAKPRLGTIIGILAVQRAIRRLDLASVEPWGQLMRQNSPSPAAIPVPALIATGLRDVIVAPAVVEDFARAACAQGKKISYFSFENGEHSTVARTEAKTVLDWIGARFARYPAPSNCGEF